MTNHLATQPIPTNQEKLRFKKITDLINAIFNNIPDEIKEIYKITNKDLPKDPIEKIARQTQWTLDLIEHIDYTLSDNGFVTINIVFENEISGEKAQFAFQI
ncbi:MAG: hypothetical protein ABII18_08285 [bacterium]|nr:hypothetical protein [bacterium]